MWFDDITFDDYKAHFGSSATVEEFHEYVASFRSLPSPPSSSGKLVKRRLPPSTEVSWRYSQRACLHMLRHPEWAIRFSDGCFTLEVVKKSRRYYLVVDSEHSFVGVKPVFCDSDGCQYYYGLSDFCEIVTLFRQQVAIYLNLVDHDVL